MILEESAISNDTTISVAVVISVFVGAVSMMAWAWMRDRTERKDYEEKFVLKEVFRAEMIGVDDKLDLILEELRAHRRIRESNNG